MNGLKEAAAGKRKKGIISLQVMKRKARIQSLSPSNP
jgi:hypothetical protein